MYGAPAVEFEVDDRTLAHVEIVVLAKLRRNESFALSVAGKADARSSVWLNPSSILQFQYAKSTQAINRQWLELLIESANSPQGLRLVDEPKADAKPDPKPASKADSKEGAKAE